MPVRGGNTHRTVGVGVPRVCLRIAFYPAMSWRHLDHFRTLLQRLYEITFQSYDPFRSELMWVVWEPQGDDLSSLEATEEYAPPVDEDCIFLGSASTVPGVESRLDPASVPAPRTRRRTRLHRAAGDGRGRVAIASKADCNWYPAEHTAGQALHQQRLRIGMDSGHTWLDERLAIERISIRQRP